MIRDPYGFLSLVLFCWCCLQIVPPLNHRLGQYFFTKHLKQIRVYHSQLHFVLVEFLEIVWMIWGDKVHWLYVCLFIYCWKKTVLLEQKQWYLIRAGKMHVVFVLRAPIYHISLEFWLALVRDLYRLYLRTCFTTFRDHLGNDKNLVV